MTLVQCYNKGCGEKFNIEENSEDACEYHPGAPIFHDAYKGWSCCNKKTTDFTTFLNTKGCAKGRHNPDKPVEPEKVRLDPSTRDEVITVKAPKLGPTLPRPDYSTPMTRLSCNVTQSLKQALQKTKDKESSKNDSTTAEEEDTEEGGIRVGESCKNNGCNMTYEAEHSNLEMCKHHPGYPVFHEGLKYWTCCRKKTTDFTEFLEQAGCSTGHHRWIKLDTKKVESCKYDWHQTGTHVCIAVYAKLADPVNTYVEANPIRLNANIVFGEAEMFTLDIELIGLIDVSQSSVTLAASKVEIKLRKAEPAKWRTLNINRKVMETKDKEEEKKDDEELEQRVDAVDLSDI